MTVHIPSSMTAEDDAKVVGRERAANARTTRTRAVTSLGFYPTQRERERARERTEGKVEARGGTRGAGTLKISSTTTRGTRCEVKSSLGARVGGEKNDRRYREGERGGERQRRAVTEARAATEAKPRAAEALGAKSSTKKPPATRSGTIAIEKSSKSLRATAIDAPSSNAPAQKPSYEIHLRRALSRASVDAVDADFLRRAVSQSIDRMSIDHPPCASTLKLIQRYYDDRLRDVMRFEHDADALQDERDALKSAYELVVCERDEAYSIRERARNAESDAKRHLEALKIERDDALSDLRRLAHVIRQVHEGIVRPEQLRDIALSARDEAMSSSTLASIVENSRENQPNTENERDYVLE